MTVEQFILRMPKVELHVHLEGSIRPQTLLTLAKRNEVMIPANTIEELKEWYQFSDFNHFIEVYFTICNCLRTPDDFELILGEFLKHQSEQNIKYSEIIFTPYTHHKHVTFEKQLAALNRARKRAETSLNIRAGLIPDIARQMRPVKESFIVADWAIQNMGNGIIALGLGGPEIDNPPEIFKETFERSHKAGLPSLPHAGETEGAQSVWGAINALSAERIGHGVRCLEDPDLVTFLREKQIPLDVSPTSNVCLGVVPSFELHPLPKLLKEGLFLTINSDDPALFNTTLTNEYLKISKTFGFDISIVKQFVINGIQASLLPSDTRHALENEFKTQFTALEKEFR